MANFEALILRGTRAAQPAAGIPGRVYFVTDEGVLELDNGATWDDISTAGSGMTNPMTTQGDVIYGGASGTPTRLAKGTAAQVLTMNSGATAPEWATSGGALVLLEQHTASNSATLDFATALTSTYDTYNIEFVNLRPASSTVSLYIRYSTDGGSTYDASNLYATANFRWVPSSTGSDGQAVAAPVAQIALGNGSIDNTANYGVTGTLKLYNPAGSTYKIMDGQIGFYGGGLMWGTIHSSVYLSTTAVNAVRFLFSAGNITSGTIRIYGVEK